MREYSGAFVAFDVAKTKHAVAVAEARRAGEVRFLGEVENTPARSGADYKGVFSAFISTAASWPFVNLLLSVR